jgi:hypothetical protein
MRTTTVILISCVCVACYPTYAALPVPIAELNAAAISETQFQAGLNLCTAAANNARSRAYSVHKAGFLSRRIGAVATLLSGSAATAASAAGRKSWATGLSATTVLSAVLTAAFIDDTESTAAEAAQVKTLTQLAGVQTAHQQYVEAVDSTEKQKALNALVLALGQCGFSPVQAIN